MILTIEMSGPTFIKLYPFIKNRGQWASSRTDIFDIELCRHLSMLQSNVSPHSLTYTINQLENTFMIRFDDMFETFDTTPVGVGAIAQVYRCTLKDCFLKMYGLDDRCDLGYGVKSNDDGNSEDLKSNNIGFNNDNLKSKKELAVKILHPNASFHVHTDLLILNIVASILEFVFTDLKWISLQEESIIFGSMMKCILFLNLLAQLNLKQEAINLFKFENNFSNWKNVSFPKAILPLCTENILFETFVDAIPLGTFMAYGPTRFDSKIGSIGLTSFLKMLILDNMLHADLHAGISDSS
jgi:aarF domain-containing kinase